MAETKKGGRLKWLLIILGVIALAVAAFFIIRGMSGDGSSFKEYNTEQSAGGVTIKLSSVERQPMVSEKCQERVTVLTSPDESYDCVIANVTVTNDSNEVYPYSYRNFAYTDPRADKPVRTAITLTSFEGVDVTEDLEPGQSHSQEVHLTIRKDVKLDDLALVYLVDPSADDGGPKITLDF